MPTANVVVTRTGTGFTIDVTACNLDPNLLLQDFNVLQGGVLVLSAPYVKTTQNILTYTGVALPTNTTVEIRRKTPNTVVRNATFDVTIHASDWQAEVDRCSRRSEEYDLNGVGNASVVTNTNPNNGVYGIAWSTDTVFPPTRQAVYNKIETLAPIASPSFTGAPLAPNAVFGTNTTQIATTAFVQASLTPINTSIALKANIASPTFTGIPAAPTAATTTNTTQLATTAFIQQELSPVNSSLALKAPLASPAFTGIPTAPTAAVGTSSTQLATTSFVQTSHFPFIDVNFGGAQTLTRGGTTKIGYNNVVSQGGVTFDTVNNQVIIPAGLGGRYHVMASISAANVTFLDLELFVNGTFIRRFANYFGTETTQVASGGVTINLNPGDVIDLRSGANNSSALAITTVTDTRLNWWTLHRIGQ